MQKQTSNKNIFPRLQPTLLALALGLGFSLNATATTTKEGSSSSKPQIQSCSLMEILHQGDRAMSYVLPCSAGDWSLSYVGSVPAGVGQVRANYRLTAEHPEGASFSIDRTLEIPSVSLLGRALRREAVVLDDGDLALRDCSEAGCSSYRPLGALKAERAALASQAKARPSAKQTKTQAEENAASATHEKTPEGLDSKQREADDVRTTSNEAPVAAIARSAIKRDSKSKDVGSGTASVISLSPATITLIPEDLQKQLVQAQADNAALKAEKEALAGSVEQQKTLIEQYTAKIEALKQRIAVLEAEIAKSSREAAENGKGKMVKVSTLPAPIKRGSTTDAEGQKVLGADFSQQTQGAVLGENSATTKAKIKTEQQKVVAVQQSKADATAAQDRNATRAIPLDPYGYPLPHAARKVPLNDIEIQYIHMGENSVIRVYTYKLPVALATENPVILGEKPSNMKKRSEK